MKNTILRKTLYMSRIMFCGITLQCVPMNMTTAYGGILTSEEGSRGLTTITRLEPVSKIEDNKSTIDKQDIRVTGRVTAADSNEGLPGVTVIVKGTTIGAPTDASGNYEITAPENGTLVFSYIGYVAQEVPVNNRTTINVSLATDEQALEEVVVVGYGTQEKVNLTGAVGTASGERLENRAIASVGEGLQGVIPNLNIAPRNGDPAQPIEFNVRGFTSINGGGPLILVDGVPMDLNRVNPNDIESISVLKDASAAAVYGARAAFGVVLVTTKSAKSGKIKVNLSTQWSLAQPIFNMDPETDPYEFVTALNTATQRGGWSWYNDFYLNATKAYSEGTGSEWVVDNGTLLFVGNNDYKNRVLTDFAPNQQHDVSISGGSENAKIFVSLGHLNKDGYLNHENNENFKRYNALMKADFKVNNWLSLDEKVVWNSQRSDKPHFYNWDVNINSLSRVDPIMPVQFPDLPYYLEPGDREVYEQYIGMYFGGTNFLPYVEEGGRTTYTNNDIWLTQGITLTPLKNLKIRGNFNYNIFNRNYSDVASRVEVVSNSLWDPTNMTNYGYSSDDWIRAESENNQYYVLNAYAEYTFDQWRDHNITAMVGFNQEEGRNSWRRAQARSLITPSVTDISATTGDQQTDGSSSHLALRGAFYRLNYNYKEKYLFEATGRYDGTSRFPQESRFGFFPSFSAGWRISNEGFMEGTRGWLDNLKLRASYGTLGNQNIWNNYYPYIASMGTGQSTYIMGDGLTPYVSAQGLVSPSLTWETVISRNLGLDFSLLRNRLDVSFDVYTRDTKDMLMSVQYPDVLGATSPRENAADLRTSGWELALTWRDNIGNNWNYDFTLALADNTSEITRYENPSGALSEHYVGKRMGEIWGYRTVGIFQTKEDIDNAPNQQRIAWNWKPGDMQYADLNGDGIISPGTNTLSDPGDRVIIGNNTARYTFGINSGISYKSFRLTAFFQGVGSRDHYPTNGRWTWFFPFRSGGVEEYYMTDSWSETNPDAYFAAPAYGGGEQNIITQTRFLQQAGYIRLKNLNLSYDLPVGLVNKVGMERAQVYITGTNLWEFSKIRKPLDPETIYSGAIEYPMQRIYSLGANISF